MCTPRFLWIPEQSIQIRTLIFTEVGENEFIPKIHTCPSWTLGTTVCAKPVVIGFDDRFKFRRYTGFRRSSNPVHDAIRFFRDLEVFA
jgi:hypothetical protein